MLSDNHIQAAKSVPLTDIVNQYTTLKRKGSEYSGNCPFHHEKTPSFYVHDTKGFNCFGCDAKGFNSIDFEINSREPFASLSFSSLSTA